MEAENALGDDVVHPMSTRVIPNDDPISITPVSNWSQDAHRKRRITPSKQSPLSLM
jgi:hypothetical protein